jgi:dihydrodipicolinate synthase/N-acetylneuraminate lyase
LKAKEFTGIIPPLLSSFARKGKIYEKGIRYTLPFVHGYYPIGTYGCGPLISSEKRKRVFTWPRARRASHGPLRNQPDD